MTPKSARRTATDRRERALLRELGSEIAAIAALPVQQETISAWKALNSLRPTRPMVVVGTTMDHVPWNEIDVDDELRLRTSDPFHQAIERDLRRTLYTWRHMRGDMVVEPFIDIPKVIHGVEENLGIVAVEDRAVTDAANRVVGHQYHDQFATDADLEKIRTPRVALDESATAEAEARAREVFDGIIAVRMTGHFPRFTPWDRIAEWRGAQTVLTDLAVRPDFMHALMNRVTTAYLARLDQLERLGLLGHSQGTIKNSGAYTDDLPAPGFDPARPRACDIWTTGMAQVFASASPAMHREFELHYAVRWYERFGLVYYGCCEPLHDRIEQVARIPHLRKISMSPWVDQERGAEAIAGRFVFSRKPNPAFLAGDTWAPDRVRRDLQATVDICARHACPLEFIIQDISTVRYEPRRLWQWIDVATDVARRAGDRS